MKRTMTLVALLMVVVLVLSAPMAEAKKNDGNQNKQRSTSVFCDRNSFDRCSNTRNFSNSTERFRGSGNTQTNNVRFQSRDTGKVFRNCTYQGTDNGRDEYFCKGKKKNR